LERRGHIVVGVSVMHHIKIPTQCVGLVQSMTHHHLITKRSLLSP